MDVICLPASRRGSNSKLLELGEEEILVQVSFGTAITERSSASVYKLADGNEENVEGTEKNKGENSGGETRRRRGGGETRRRRGGGETRRRHSGGKMREALREMGEWRLERRDL
ncbi:hypothetical protein YC2023_071241 [Brassica napus]